ncbi:RNA polymerase sigma factor for flagellar operon FliA [Gracilibacillus halotolerans]|uniref:RNA polymerase sigma factor for flagellar operon FliA n=1 Tax=Gracilibacillus halotolerans TaxID=74386 RepID=A0A841RIH7_9BACI|nr:RNA polymerase sigma factor for flagellar operon FliA [Gracilibacillus halotolerans]
MVKEIAYETTLWDNWNKNQNEDNANELLEAYMYLVHYHVQRIIPTLPKSVDREDIKSLGLYGLYDALLKFDSSRDLKFDTYASIRIKGAILDGLRKEDWLPRSTREKIKKIDRAQEDLEQKYQREVSIKEIAEHAQLEENEVMEAQKDSFFANLLSIDEQSNQLNDENNDGIGNLIRDDQDITPEKELLKKENYAYLIQAIKQLKEKEQLVLSLFYDKELTFTEIGNILGLTTSRISQIHKQSISKVRQIMAQENTLKSGAE